MRTVTLTGTDLATSVLGFGAVGGKLNDSERSRIYEAAFDAGIRHFDTARGYSLGAAEGVLGRFLEGRRDQVTVTTKLGILPPASGSLLRTAKVLARGVQKLAPGFGAKAKQAAASRLSATGRFSVSDAEESLNTSLRELRMDHVDILLLHEVGPSDISDELLSFLERCVAEGKVSATGIAAGPANTLSILSSGHRFPAVVQVANEATPMLPRESMRGRGCIVHGVFSGLEELRAGLAASPEMRTTWSEEVGADLTRPGVLEGLLIQDALASTAEIVLFRSSSATHIKSNVAATSEVVAEPQVSRFSRLVRGQWTRGV